MTFLNQGANDFLVHMRLEDIAKYTIRRKTLDSRITLSTIWLTIKQLIKQSNYSHLYRSELVYAIAFWPRYPFLSHFGLDDYTHNFQIGVATFVFYTYILLNC